MGRFQMNIWRQMDDAIDKSGVCPQISAGNQTRIVESIRNPSGNIAPTRAF